MKKMNKKGFTIVELVIVIAVIAILAAVLIPTFSGVVEKAKASNRLQAAKNAYTAALAADADANLGSFYVTVTDGSTPHYFGITGNGTFGVLESAPTASGSEVFATVTGVTDIPSGVTVTATAFAE